MSEQTAQPSPMLFFDTVNAYQRTEALKAAIELDLFTAIAENAQTAAELASRCQAAERGIRILCDFLTIRGFLTKTENHYNLTQDSAIFLNRHSPAYVGGAIEFLLSPTLRAGFGDVTGAVRKGGTTVSEEGTVSYENPVWIKFARGMAPLVVMTAQQIAELLGDDTSQKLRVLDIAAGHGMFGIAVAQRFSQAEITALDWANVLEVATENAEKMGVGARHKTIAGSAFDVDFGGEYDVILLTNFLHHFDEVTCENFLKKVHASLAEGGRVVTLDFIPETDRVSPPLSAAFSMVMLCTTPHGDAYTFDELDKMFTAAGFSRSDMQRLIPIGDVMISHK